MAGILFIISAPSGSGKSTLVSELRKQVSGVDFAVSWTTRAPRGSEENGREYNFTTREEFERMIDAGRVSGVRRGLRQLLRHGAAVA